MTGLDAERCHLLEIACIITDDQLDVIARVWIITISLLLLFSLANIHLHFAILLFLNINLQGNSVPL